MESILLIASSKRWFTKACFATLILTLVYFVGMSIEYILEVNSQTMDSIHVRGSFFLVLFLFTLVIASVFSRGSHYKNPAISLLLIFIVQTLIIFLVMSLFSSAQLVKTITFPLVYSLGYFLFLYRDVVTYKMYSLLGRTGWARLTADSLVRSTQKTINSVLILNGLKYMAMLYVFYSAIDVFYMISAKDSVLVTCLDFLNHAVLGRYFMDAITLYFIIILLAGLSKSIRESKDSKVDF